MSNGLRKLKVLADQMEESDSPLLEDIVATRTYNEVKTEIGEPLMVFYFGRNASVAVVDAVCWEGSILGYHQHEETEIMTVYVGRMVVEFEDGDEAISLGVKDTIKIEPRKAHRATFMENTRVVCLTIPPSRGYPDDGNQEFLGRVGPASISGA